MQRTEVSRIQLEICNHLDCHQLLQLHTEGDSQTDRQTDKQTDKQTNKQTNRQTDKQTDLVYYGMCTKGLEKNVKYDKYRSGIIPVNLFIWWDIFY